MSDMEAPLCQQCAQTNQLVKNPWGPNGFSCGLCARHVRGSAFVCNTCEEWCVCKPCGHRIQKQQRIEEAQKEQAVAQKKQELEQAAAFQEQAAAHNYYEEQMPYAQHHYGEFDYHAGRQNENENARLAALAFGTLTEREYESARTSPRPTEAVAVPLATPLVGDAPEFWPAPVPSAPSPSPTTLLQHFPTTVAQHQYGLKHQYHKQQEQPVENDKFSQQHICLNCAHKSNSLEASLATFIDVLRGIDKVEEEDSTTDENCQRAWDLLIAEREKLPASSTHNEQSDNATVEAMLQAARWKFKEGERQRAKLELELDQTQKQLLRAMSGISTLTKRLKQK